MRSVINIVGVASEEAGVTAVTSCSTDLAPFVNEQINSVKWCFLRRKLAYIANMLDISPNPKPLYSTFKQVSNKLRSIFWHFLLDVPFLSMAFKVSYRITSIDKRGTCIDNGAREVWCGLFNRGVDGEYSTFRFVGMSGTDATRGDCFLEYVSFLL